MILSIISSCKLTLQGSPSYQYLDIPKFTPCSPGKLISTIAFLKYLSFKIFLLVIRGLKCIGWKGGTSNGTTTANVSALWVLQWIQSHWIPEESLMLKNMTFSHSLFYARCTTKLICLSCASVGFLLPDSWVIPTFALCNTIWYTQWHNPVVLLCDSDYPTPHHL